MAFYLITSLDGLDIAVRPLDSAKSKRIPVSKDETLITVTVDLSFQGLIEIHQGSASNEAKGFESGHLSNKNDLDPGECAGTNP